MRELLVRKLPLGADVGRLKEVRETHVGRLVDFPARLVEEGTGRLLAVFGRAPGIDSRFLEEIRYGRSQRTRGMPSESKTFGSLPRVPIRRDFCTKSVLARDAPDLNARLLDLGAHSGAFLEEHHPAQAAEQRGLLKAKVRSCWHLPGGLFTSGIVNRNNALWYHHDRGNFRGSWSVMYATRSGLRGGYLVMPEYGVSFDFGEPGFIAFDGQSILHGVSPLKAAHGRVARFSVVFYAMEGMGKCLDPAGELLRIRKVKTEREIRRARGQTNATGHYRKKEIDEAVRKAGAE